jgi:hypothetical protein
MSAPGSKRDFRPAPRDAVAPGADPVARDHPLRERRRGWGTLVPAWYLRLRLQWARQGIERIEQQLADEFALLETEPLHRELFRLTAERDALLQRLAPRS